MFCPHCGTQLSDTARFCKSCGASQIPTQPTPSIIPSSSAASRFQLSPPPGYQQPVAVPPNPPQGYAYTTPGLVGFSPRIQDPAFDKYRKNAKKWALFFAVILFVIACIGFPIYGNASGEIDWPQSLYYGMGIGGMFVVIALIQTMRQSRDTTWDGTVVDKTAVRKQRNDRDGTGVTTYMQYTVDIRKDDGKTKKHVAFDHSGLYNYLRVGDRVRHHKGFAVYEKYDKSQDVEIMCVACAKMNSVLTDVCDRCKCPVLKG